MGRARDQGTWQSRPREQPDDLAVRLRQARLATLLQPTQVRARPPAPTPLDSLIERTAQVYAGSLSDHTRQSYASRWRQFDRWAVGRGLGSLPAAPETVMLYLAESVESSPAPSLSTLRGRLAAINRVHVEAGHTAPGDDPAMAMLVRGLGRVVRSPPPRPSVSALRIADLREALLVMQGVDPRLTRDKAMLALLRAGITAEHLSRLLWEDVRAHSRGLRVGLRDRPSSPATRYVQLQRVRDQALCPVRAVLDWRAMAGEEPANVFTLVDGAGCRDARPIHAYNITRMAAARLDSLGPDGHPVGTDDALRLLSGEPSVVLRDRALLLVGFAGAFRRNELCNLRWNDVRDDPGGLVLRVRRSKTDVAGRGRDVGIPRGTATLTCPVSAVERWRERTRRQLGASWRDDLPFLVRVGRAGRIGTEPVTPAALSRIVSRRARDAMLDGHWGGRSLRAGFITTAAELGIPLDRIARQSRHASLDNLVRYIRAEDPFKGNPAGWVGL